jgi:hypothetical protein
MMGWVGLKGNGNGGDAFAGSFQRCPHRAADSDAVGDVFAVINA